jgi:hypothetical protein
MLAMEPRAVPGGELLAHFVRLAPADISYLKFVLESYEGVGFLRTVDPKAAIVVVLVVPDFAAEGQAILQSVAREIEVERVPGPPTLGEDWLVARIFEEAKGSEPEDPGP